MSRAIDPKTAANLNSVNLQQVYEELTQTLTLPSYPSTTLLEIEILKEFHFPPGQTILKDNNFIAISKLALVQSFLFARTRLRAYQTDPTLFSSDDISSATFTILLFDPEHLTAANTRKRLLQSELQRQNSDHRTVLEQEKRTVDSLLTSRLHRHTKSPVLWSHRRWLITQYAKYGLSVEVTGDIERIVCVAGERHPRNYYAWCHARFLVNISNNNFNRGKLLEIVQTWCAQNHTDISGWSFLSFLLGRDKDAPGVIAKVLDLVESLRLSNESVWVFLPTLAAAGVMTEEAYSRFLEIQKELLEMETTAVADRAVLRRAVEWCETYRSPSADRVRG
ncbi:hypothetical protein QC762_307100 [Podospora pseudocomata]|uniref:Uncharacterized protein n=1 Tax=Podospora pseudocomata TaxID=2093779 RepID=A0ABR0GJQ1_9PEZI|nr:hypothetical protein QC762_307100 [Podospora pseudocomata]